MIAPKDVWILYSTEMRAALRERNILVNSILIPILLYPFILWAIFTGIMFVQGQTAGFISRVVLCGWPPGHAELRQKLEKNRQVDRIKENLDVSQAIQRIQDGALEALVEFLPAEGEQTKLPGNFKARLTYMESKERSVAAKL